MPNPNRPPSPRIAQLVKDPDSWAYGLKPNQAERVAVRVQKSGLLDPCASCGA